MSKTGLGIYQIKASMTNVRVQQRYNISFLSVHCITRAANQPNITIRTANISSLLKFYNKYSMLGMFSSSCMCLNQSRWWTQKNFGTKEISFPISKVGVESQQGGNLLAARPNWPGQLWRPELQVQTSTLWVRANRSQELIDRLAAVHGTIYRQGSIGFIETPNQRWSLPYQCNISILTPKTASLIG